MSEIWWSDLQAFARSVQNIPNKSQWLEFSTPAPKDQLPTLILREKYNQGFGPPAITDTYIFKSYYLFPQLLFQVTGTDDSAKHLGDEKSPRNSERQREHLRVDAGENFACFDLFWQNSIKWKDRLNTVHCPSCTFWATTWDWDMHTSNSAPPMFSQLGLKSMNIYKKICLLWSIMLSLDFL